jgi:FkbM family methyltransferase
MKSPRREYAPRSGFRNWHDVPVNSLTFRFRYRGWRARFRDHRAEIHALTRALRQEDVAVDVGANKGSFLPSLSRAVPSGTVFAFEPQPVLAAYLEVAVASAGLSNVVVEAQGVSDRAGRLTLGIPGEGESSPGASFEESIKSGGRCRLVEVPVCTLDEYFAGERRRIGAIKIDVEGHELAMLRGCENILRSHKPAIVCESESRHMAGRSVTTVLDYFRSMGYDGFFVHRSRLVPIAEFDATRHQRAVGDRYWNDKDYCNNFVLTAVRS